MPHPEMELVSEYKKMGGKYKGAKKKAVGGEVNNSNLKPIPADNKGLPNLPKKVRNKMGFMKKGGRAGHKGGGRSR